MNAGAFEFPFEKIEVYKMAVDLAERVLLLLEGFPGNKHFRLIGQMESAAVSISQNIAEGKGRQYKKEFIQFLHIAQGSIFEVVTLNEIFGEENYSVKKRLLRLELSVSLIDRKINGLINSLRGKQRKPKVEG